MNLRGFSRMLCWIALSIFLCLGHDTLLGQITYTFADAQANFAIGKSYTIVEVNGPVSVTVGSPSSTAQVWSFTGFTPHDYAATTGVTVSSAAGAAQFPTANTCLRMDTTSGSTQALASFHFFNLTSSSLSLLGMTDGTGLLLFKWNPQWPQLQFPLAMGSAWTYASKPESTQVSPGVVMISYRNITYTVDAFGTLRLPQGDFSALRIKEVDQYTTAMPPLYSNTTKTIIYSYVTKEGVTTTVSIDSTQENLATVVAQQGFTYMRVGRSTAVESATTLTPGDFRLEQNFPNPFNSTTVVSFQLSVASDVRLGVYDLLGHEVAVLVNAKTGPGFYQVRFDASGLASGIYLYRLDAGGKQITRRLAYIK